MRHASARWATGHDADQARACSGRRAAGWRRPMRTRPGAMLPLGRVDAALPDCGAPAAGAAQPQQRSWRWRRWRRSGRRSTRRSRATAPTASAWWSAPAPRASARPKARLRSHAADGALPDGFPLRPAGDGFAGGDAGAGAGRQRSRLRAFERLLVERQGDGQRRAPDQHGPVRRGGHAAASIRCAPSRWPAFARSNRSARAAAIRSARTATASTSAKARRCS